MVTTADQHGMTETRIDTVVLDRYNGRNSLYIVSMSDSYPILHWLMVGQVEDIDIWCRVPLSWGEAEDLCDNVPTLMDGYIASLPARTITLVADAGHDPAVTQTYQTGQSDTPTVHALLELRDSLPARVTAGETTQADADQFTAHINQVHTTEGDQARGA